MKNMTVTGELRKSIQKVMKQDNPWFGRTWQLTVFSDSRLNKAAVGVKIVQLTPTTKQIHDIVNDMESKGFELAYVHKNVGGCTYHGGYYSGTRFCFYKLNTSNIN